MLSLDLVELFVRLTAGKSTFEVSQRPELDVTSALDVGGSALALFGDPSLALLGSSSKLVGCGLKLTDKPSGTCDLEGAAKQAVDAVKDSPKLQTSILAYLQAKFGIVLAGKDFGTIP